MSVTIDEVRQALAQAVKNGTGLDCSPYVLDQVNAPCAMVDRQGFDPRLVMVSTKSVYRLRVVMFMARLSDIDAQKAIDAYCDLTGEHSVRAAIEDGSLWTTTVDYAAVTNIGDTVEREVAGAVYLVTEFDVEVCW